MAQATIISGLFLGFQPCSQWLDGSCFNICQNMTVLRWKVPQRSPKFPRVQAKELTCLHTLLPPHSYPQPVFLHPPLFTLLSHTDCLAVLWSHWAHSYLRGFVPAIPSTRTLLTPVNTALLLNDWQGFLLPLNVRLHPVPLIPVHFSP